MCLTGDNDNALFCSAGSAHQDRSAGGHQGHGRHGGKYSVARDAALIAVSLLKKIHAAATCARLRLAIEIATAIIFSERVSRERKRER